MNSALRVSWLAGLEVIMKIYALLSIRRDKIARQEWTSLIYHFSIHWQK